jgi:uncharacterized protein YacL
MWLIYLLVALGAALAAHATLSRTAKGLNRVVGFLIVGSTAGFGLLAALASRYGAASIQMLSALALYAFLCELYIFLFTLAMSSISANLLVRLDRGGLTEDEIDRLYDSSKMVDGRIGRLMATHLLTEESSTLVPTAEGTRLLRILDRLRRFFRHERTRAPVTQADG